MAESTGTFDAGHRDLRYLYQTFCPDGPSLQKGKERKKDTSTGVMTVDMVALYDGTPRHRDNFLQLVRAHSYEGTLFHRVIDRLRRL